MFRELKCVASISSVQSIAAANTDDCKLIPIRVYPVSPEPADTFADQAGFIEVQFTNDTTVVSPDAFPESPLAVKNHQSNTTCSIDGGVWVRAFLFASSDNQILITREYSGSNEFIDFYDTQTCEKISELDLSGFTVSVGRSGALAVISKR